MRAIDCSLLSDGPSDAALLPMIRWSVQQHAAGSAVEAMWADLRRSRRRLGTLADRIVEAAALYPCDILFVHRDAESQPYDWRVREISAAIAQAQQRGVRVPHVCVVPVRMQEAWLLLDEVAIRRAVGNPHGAMALDLPAPGRIERLRDPKETLYGVLCIASGLGSRRLRAFRPGRCAQLVSEYIRDMAALRQLPAFQRFEADVRAALARMQRESVNG